jgi:pilus assembly protein CpaF
MTEPTQRRRPDWEHAGGVATMDAGQFAAVVASARALQFTSMQLDAVRDVLHRARGAGADLVCLDPTAPPGVRLPAFGAILRPAIARGEIPGMSLSDTATLAALFDAALGWGPAVQPILDDAGITELKLIGRTVLAEGQRGRILVTDAYADVAEPGSRVRALAQLIGVTWDAAHPSVTIPLANKTRMHATSTPLLAEDDQLIIFRRGRLHPWTFADQVARHSLDERAATLLCGILQAQPSVLISGAQNAGKTTVLECALNALPPNLHLVLVEDNTDEFSLATPLVTRLRVPAGAESYATIVRETLRMTPDLLVPGEIRGAEAGAIAQMAEAGRPTLTTIHARTPLAALHRFARLAASDIPGNSFARQSNAAQRVICESFQLVIHTQYLRRLQRRIVRSVLVLDGLDAAGVPVLHPLIETVMDPAAAGGVRWVCHAALVDGALVWEDGHDRTPAALAEALSDVPHGGAAPLLTETAATSVANLLAQVRELLPYDDQAPAIERLLNTARDLDPGHYDLWPLAERVLATNQAAAAQVAVVGETAVANLRAALATRDLEAAVAVIAAARQNVLTWVALHQSAAWAEASVAYETLQAQVEDVTTALAEARQLTEGGELAAALRRLQGFHAPSLPSAQAEELLAARIGLLTAQQRLADPVSAQAIVQQLRILDEQQRRLQTGPANAPDAAWPDPSGGKGRDVTQNTSDGPPAALLPAATARRTSESTHIGSALAEPDAAPETNTAAEEVMWPSRVLEGDGSWIENTDAASADAAQPSDHEVAPCDAAETLTGLEDLPIRVRAAADVGTGSWAAIFDRHPDRRQSSGGT